MKATTRLVFSALLASAQALAVSAQSSPQQQGPPPLPFGHPDTELWGSFKRNYPLQGDGSELSGTVRYDTIEQRILLLWRYELYQSGETRIYSQEEPVAFWPTETSRLNGTDVLVAGRRANGKTVIQVWELDVHVDVPDPVFDPGSGTWSYPQSLVVPILRKSTIYDEDTAGRRMVRAMWPNRGEAWGFFVQFHDSGDLYRAALQDTGSQWVLASLDEVMTPDSDPPTGVVSEPGLATTYTDRWDDDHVAHGFVYFAGDSPETASGIPGGLVLFDADRDGSLDGSMVITVVEWVSMGFQDSAQYNPYW